MIHVFYDNNTLEVYQWCDDNWFVWYTKGNTQMFIAMTFGLYFALLGWIAWEDNHSAS
jgi:hypothetical protein